MSRLVTVRSCARCGQDHEDMVFEPLSNASDEWEWWGMCRTNQQPVLLRDVPDNYVMPVDAVEIMKQRTWGVLPTWAHGEPVQWVVVPTTDHPLPKERMSMSFSCPAIALREQNKWYVENVETPRRA